ncbi:MAG TPA: hypothetical protein VLG48_06325 [Candidatus Methylomirabilis sp.]|nr:hypothetical protein [Candidatus Methylomirabilis sp.]
MSTLQVQALDRRFSELPRQVDGIIAACARRRTWCALLVAALLAMQISPWWRPTPDASAYLSMARSLATSGHITRFGNPQWYYAPGYPTLISPAFLTGDRPFLAISLIHFSLGLTLMLGLYLWARQVAFEAAMPVTALVMVNVGLWEHYRRTISELAFMAALAWLALALSHVCKASFPRQKLAWVAMSALLLAALCAVRQIGLLVVFGFGAVMMVDAATRRRPWTEAITFTAAVALPATLLVLALVLREHALVRPAVDNTTYITQLADQHVDIPEGFRLRIGEIGRLLLPGMLKAYGRRNDWLNINTLLYLSLAALIAPGWWRAARRTADPLVATLPFYVAFYIVWPFDQGVRFMLPLLPVLWLSVWQTLEALPRGRGPVVVLLVVAHLGVAIGYWVRELATVRQLDALWPEVMAVTQPLGRRERVVATQGIPAEQQLMLWVAVDRMMKNANGPQDIEDRTDCLVAGIATPQPGGFSPQRQAGPFVLLCREDLRETSSRVGNSLRPSHGR